MYFKGFDANLCGYNNYPFEVSAVYETEDWDTWSWFHYTKYVSATLNYFESDMRVCEVEPLGKTKFFRDALDGYRKGYYTTNRLHIVRELSREEIFDRLMQEKCPVYLLLKLNPPYEVLLQIKSHIRGSYCHKVLHRKDLSDDEKRQLLPACWHKYISIIYED